MQLNHPSLSKNPHKLLLLLLIMLSSACGRRDASPPEPASPTLEFVLNPLGPLVSSTVVGHEVSLRVLALKTAGQAIESSEHLLPASGEVISWTILGTPLGSPSLSQSETLTDTEGTSQVVMHVGTTGNSNIQVQAKLRDQDPITFTVKVLPDQRRLNLLFESPMTTVVDRTERLRVRLVRINPDNSDGAPIAGVTLYAELIGGPRNGAQFLNEPSELISAETDTTGMALFSFQTGVATVPYEIEFCGNARCEGVGLTQTHIEVGLRDNNLECVYFTDCEPGFICENNHCVPPDAYCDSDVDCPPGYVCDSSTRRCVLSTEDVPCDEATDCPPGWECDEDGDCAPPDTTGPILDVRGHWNTRHHFDLSDTLPGVFTDFLGPIVDFLDLLFRSQLEIDIPILGDLLEALIDQVLAQYVPGWVEQVVVALGDFIHVFENMETSGEMLLMQLPETPQLGPLVTGNEDWTSAFFFIPSLCPGGVQEFNQDPTCGQVDLVVEPTVTVGYSNNDPSVGIEVQPFNGSVQNETLWLTNRDVLFSMNQLINVLLDIIVSVASNGDFYDFEEFLVDIVPCEDLQYAIDDLICDVTDGNVCSVPGIEALCEMASVLATAALTDLLGTFEAPLHLIFDARAHIHDPNGDMIADALGSESNPNATNESALIGDSSLIWVFGGDLDEDSWWYGLRP